MADKKSQEGLEDVEPIPREQAEQKMHDAVRRSQQKETQQASGTKKPEPIDDEPVTPETRQKAEHELHEALERVRRERKAQ